MTLRVTRRNALRNLALGGIAPAHLLSALAHGGEQNRPESGAKYRLEFSYPMDDLIGDLEHSERGDPRSESEVPFHEWYSHAVRHRFGGWGPKPRTYPPLPGHEQRPIEWKRQRVIALAARYLGYGYQHHHIPDWSPPADWHWKETCVGHNGKGVDCSNFTSFVYNQGFGIRMTSAVARQAELHEAQEENGFRVSLRRVELPRQYERRQEVLRTGDLIYIRGREDGPITHVVIWTGSVGRAPSGVPIVLDSHGSGVKDDQGNVIPCGIQLRPFRQHSWYDQCASHAHRIFHDTTI
jgi:cell wall-associated NlpC family hydrolase